MLMFYFSLSLYALTSMYFSFLKAKLFEMLYIDIHFKSLFVCFWVL